MGTPTYDPNKVECIFNGRALTDFAKETFIGIAPQGDGQQLTKGVKDKSGWVVDADSSHEVTLTMMQQGADNDFLSGVYSAQKAGVLGDGALLIKDLSGRTLFESHTVRIANFPEQEMSNDAQNIPWALRCAEVPARFVGGNNPL